MLAFVVLYRPVACGLLHSLSSDTVFGLLLLASALLWLMSELLGGALRIRVGLPGLAFSVFLAAALVSSIRAENWFAGLQWCLVLATYGLTAFLVLQMADGELERRFLLSCLLASGVGLAAYGLWHYQFYMPALRTWLAREPGFFKDVVGAAGPLSGELEARVAANRAYGSFVTPNQLADFLVLTFLPLAGYVVARWRGARADGRARLAGWPANSWCALAALSMAAALYLTGSKGGWIALGFGLAVFVLAAAGPALRRHAWQVLIVVALIAVALLLAYEAHAVPGPRDFARSLGVRIGYWQTSAEIALKRPVLGVGPGSWQEWYTMLKRPEFEETKSPHSLYFQLWAETGAVGLLLWIGLWAAVFTCPIKDIVVPDPTIRADARHSAGLAGGADGHSLTQPLLMATGLLLPALALGYDWTVVGTFAAPKYVAPWIEGTPLLPYAVVYAVWATTFAVLFAMREPLETPLIRGAIAAGLAAFLLHSAAEFTLEVPAIGGSVAVLAALLLSGRRLSTRTIPLPPAARSAVLLTCAAALAFWSIRVTQAAIGAALNKDEAEREQSALAGGNGAAMAASSGRFFAVRDDLRRVCAAVPWDDRSWRDLASWQLFMAQAGLDGSSLSEGTQAAARAVELNPLSTSNWALLGSARALAGDLPGAAQAYRRAAELHPSLPEAWYRCGAALEAAREPAAAPAAAYRKALELMPRQYHERNTVLGPQEELMAVWQVLSGAASAPPLLEVALDLGRRTGGATIPAGASEVQAVSALARGLRGGGELVRRWNSYDAASRERQLWSVTAGRLWQWALEAKVKALEGGGQDAPSGRNQVGAGGGT